jgi:hypothetical protein
MIILFIYVYSFPRHAIAVNVALWRCDVVANGRGKEKGRRVGEFGKRLYICR